MVGALIDPAIEVVVHAVGAVGLGVSPVGIPVHEQLGEVQPLSTGVAIEDHQSARTLVVGGTATGRVGVRGEHHIGNVVCADASIAIVVGEVAHHRRHHDLVEGVVGVGGSPRPLHFWCKSDVDRDRLACAVFVGKNRFASGWVVQVVAFRGRLRPGVGAGVGAGSSAGRAGVIAAAGLERHPDDGTGVFRAASNGGEGQQAEQAVGTHLISKNRSVHLLGDSLAEPFRYLTWVECVLRNGVLTRASKEQIRAGRCAPACLGPVLWACPPRAQSHWPWATAIACWSLRTKLEHSIPSCTRP